MRNSGSEHPKRSQSADLDVYTFSRVSHPSLPGNLTVQPQPTLLVPGSSIRWVQAEVVVWQGGSPLKALPQWLEHKVCWPLQLSQGVPFQEVSRGRCVSKEDASVKQTHVCFTGFFIWSSCEIINIKYILVSAPVIGSQHRLFKPL